MRRLTFATLGAILLASLLCPCNLSAQTVCDQGNGHLDPAQPAEIASAEIIQKFAAKETIFKAAREHYGYVLNVSVQSLDNYGRVDGEYRQISQIALNDEGKRAETTTFAPMNTLRRLFLTQDDLDDFHERLPLMLTPEDLPNFLVTYAGRQRVDELNTYVFDVSPQNEKQEKKAFEGRIWVDDQDFMIVKTCGKPR